jgi:4-amino-4-deoxy-L-arabinose transferase-like glycosyltransferase
LNWRLQAASIVLAALVLRTLFFVGFGLGDDLGYVGHVDQILKGEYPPLDPLNQYAYRPLLLYLFAAGVALFGHTDLGVVAAVLAASLVTTALVFLFVRKLIDPDAAWWCALLFAFQPFDVVNSTTMTNDVILSCLTFASMGLFLAADRSSSAKLFVASAGLMFAAFLVKISSVAALAAIGLYSLAALRRNPVSVARRHAVFYVTFLLCVIGLCVVYYIEKGDFLWQFKSEAFYYQIYKPDWYVAGHIDYRQLMWQYPRSLFGLSGFGSCRYLDHGFLFWLFVPASVLLLLRRRNAVTMFLVASTIVIFAFFEFYPQYMTPRYLPLVRQERYLEMLVPCAVIVVGLALHALYGRRRVVALSILVLLLGNFVVEASRRSDLYRDSQQDVRELARYARSTIPSTGKRLAVDMPAGNSLLFYLKDQPIALEQIDRAALAELSDCYVAIGGARSFWWSRGLVVDLPPDAIPAHWVLAYEVAGQQRPWRPTNLRVYYVGVPSSDWYALFDQPQWPAPAPAPTLEGLTETAFPDGFDGRQMPVGMRREIPDLEGPSVMPATRLEWTGWLAAEDGVYRFESTSDDGSWIYVNDKLLLDNGGTHPARTVRRTVRLGKGWYRFRLRYEDTGGGRRLRFRVYRDDVPTPLLQRAMFFSSPAGDVQPRSSRHVGR